MVYLQFLAIALLSALISANDLCAYTKTDEHLKCSDFTSFTELDLKQLRQQNFSISKLTFQASSKNSHLLIDSDLDFSGFKFNPVPKIILRNFKGYVLFCFVSKLKE